MSEAGPDATQVLDELTAKSARLKSELSKAIIGQESVIDDVMLALFCGEHAILTGVPGLAKTLLIRSLASALHLSFSREGHPSNSYCSGARRTSPTRPADRVGSSAGLRWP